jgi:Fe-S-cluster containining protein
MQCGLCCNGVIFADVRSELGAAVTALNHLGAKPKNVFSRDGIKRCSIGQPCVAFVGGKCQIYSERPNHCRKFDCLMLEKLKRNERSMAASLKIVERAKRLSLNVVQLLAKLGNTEEHLPLSHRFRRAVRTMEDAARHRSGSQSYADLTVRYHELTHLLSAEFYQGDS